MVRILLFFILLLPAMIFSAEFTARVNRKQVSIGENVILTLILRDIAATEKPDTQALDSSFLIGSEQQSYSTKYVNGRVTSENFWTLHLVPKKEGEIIIPSISINTAAGTLSSKPVTIQVVKGAVRSENSEMNDITLTIDVSNEKPFKNEPFIYTVKLTSKRPLVNLRMQKLSLDDAIADLNGEPKVYQKIVDGSRVDVVEFSYLITPLKPGTFEIPSNILQGDIPVKQQLGGGGSFFDDDFDPFAMMHGFVRYKPFSLKIESVNIEVQPPVASVNPWLPAKALKLEETWNESQQLQVGEPMTISFKVTAEGIKSAQLPALNDQLSTISGFKVYADKPDLNEEVIDGKIISSRKEEYTLIPQNPGTLTIPEVSVSWWNVSKNEKAVTQLPTKKLQIAPAAISQKNDQIVEAVAAANPSLTSDISQHDPILYALLGALIIVLFGVILWAIALQRKLLSLARPKPVQKKPAEDLHKYAPPPKKSPSKDKKEKLPDLNPT